MVLRCVCANANPPPQVSGREPFPGRPSPRTLQMPGASPGTRPSNVVLYYDEDPPPPTPTLASKSGLLPSGQVSCCVPDGTAGLVTKIYRVNHGRAVLSAMLMPMMMLVNVLTLGC